MSEFRELSKLPQQEEYWLALERRIVEHSMAPADPLQGRAFGWLGLAGAAAIAALLLMPGRTAIQPATSGSLGYLQLPEEANLLIAPAPPPVGALILPEPANE